MYTRVTGSNFTYCLKKELITIGRRSQLPIDICLGNSVCISRKHLELHTVNKSLFLRVLGKNGIFIDEEFHMFGDGLIPLPNCCRLRFPSTSITLVVEILDSNSSLRHPKKRTIWRYSAELAGLTENGIRASDHFNEKQPKLPTDSKADDDSVQSDRKPTLNTPIALSTVSAAVSSLCKSDSTEPFSTPETCSPMEPLLQNFNHSKFQRLDFTAGEQSTSLRFPNLLAAYSRNSPKSASVSNGKTSLKANSGQGIPFDRCSSTSPGDTECLFPAMRANEEMFPGNLERTTKVVDREPKYEKPPYSYAQLIVQAIASAPNRRLTLSDIYNYIFTQFPYYKPNQKGWQNSIRHNLSLNRYFIRTPRGQEEPGKGAFWRLDPKSEAHLVVKAFQNRRQRSYAIPACMAGRTSPQHNSTSLAYTNTASSSADDVVTPPHRIEVGDVAGSLGYKSSPCNIHDPVPASLPSNSNAESTFRADFLAKEAMASGLPLFGNPTKGLFSHDESILASSLLMTANPPTTAASLYSHIQGYCHLHKNGIFPSLLFLPSASTVAHPDIAACGRRCTTHMPNLTESLQRSDADSVSHQVSEPNLQKFPDPLKHVSEDAETAAASVATDDSIMMRQKV